jgi:PAS domain S-box-containing protein
MVLSEEALAIFGVEKKNVATLEEIVALVHPEDKLRVEQSLNAAIEKKAHHVLEHRAIRPDGKVIYVRTMAELYNDTDEKSVRLLGTIMDITEQKHAEMRNSKLEAENQLLQKAESLGRMAGAIAHHFNNNLGAVIGNLEMVIDDLPEDAKPHSNLAAAMQAALKAAEISGLMLTYLGQTTGKRTLLNLSEACHSSLLLLQVAVPKNIVINVDLPTPGPTIRANANQLQQLLTNLVTNAWEAIGEKSGSIDVIVKVVSQPDISTVQRFPVDWQPQNLS